MRAQARALLPRAYGQVFAAMLALHARSSKIDHLTVAEEMREAGQLEAIGGAAAIDELAGWVPAAGHAREYGRIIRENAQLRDQVRGAYDILARVHGRVASVGELGERAERAMLEVAHDERRKSVTPIGQALDAEVDQIHARSVAKSPLTWHAVGVQGARRADGWLSAWVSDGAGGTAGHGQVGARCQHRRERGHRRTRSRDLLARDVRGGAVRRVVNERLARTDEGGGTQRQPLHPRKPGCKPSQLGQLVRETFA
jgi:hypothetical protein